jgi:hypothetical protein
MVGVTGRQGFPYASRGHTFWPFILASGANIKKARFVMNQAKGQYRKPCLGGVQRSRRRYHLGMYAFHFCEFHKQRLDLAMLIRTGHMNDFHVSILLRAWKSSNRVYTAIGGFQVSGPLLTNDQPKRSKVRQGRTDAAIKAAWWVHNSEHFV